MTLPTITAPPTPVPNKTMIQAVFDAAIDATLGWNVTHAAETVILVTWMQAKRDEVAATALLTGSLPALAGNAKKLLRVNAAETAAEFAPINPVALEGYTTTVTAGGTTTLTAASSSHQRFTGSLSQTIVLPDPATLELGWEYFIDGASLGPLTVNSSGSNLVATVPAGMSARVKCVLASGTTAASWSVIIIDPFGGIPVGTTIYGSWTSAPPGTLKENGALVSRTTYARLFAEIGTTYGAGDGSTTFALPESRGEFVRGLDDGRGVDSGRALGVAQLDALQNITGNVANDMGGGATGAFAWTSTGPTKSGGGTAFGTTTFDASRVARTSTETRARNVARLACIKY
jgi:microcystin-dependent protein